jgi:N-methylhydantoinase B/oxoprolinase/acetone carboxylase alpha subunit
MPGGEGLANEHRLPGKVTFDAEEGDIISIRSPGGGGWGKKE